MGLFNKTTEDKKSAADEKAVKAAAVAPKAKTEKKASTKELYSETAASKSKTAKRESKYEHAYRILVKPLITEKATIAGSINKYFFEVSKEANKIEVSKAVEKVYGVKPADVNIVNVKGKNVTYGRKKGKRKDWKKAIVTLAKGESIKVYEGV